MQGEQQVASVIPQFYQWFLPQVMNAMTGNSATAMQGMSAVTGAETQRGNANQASQTALMQSGMQLAGQMLPTTSYRFEGKA